MTFPLTFVGFMIGLGWLSLWPIGLQILMVWLTWDSIRFNKSAKRREEREVNCPKCGKELGQEGNPTNVAHAEWYYCYNEACSITYVGLWQVRMSLNKEGKTES